MINRNFLTKSPCTKSLAPYNAHPLTRQTAKANAVYSANRMQNVQLIRKPQ